MISSPYQYPISNTFINPTVSTIIPGMRKLRHVEANMAASDQGPLEADPQVQLRQHRWDRELTEWSQ